MRLLGFASAVFAAASCERAAGGQGKRTCGFCPSPRVGAGPSRSRQPRATVPFPTASPAECVRLWIFARPLGSKMPRVCCSFAFLLHMSWGYLRFWP